MIVELIPEKGVFYKVNMHCHTNISDGENTPEEIKAIYKKAGYSAVCFTDHEVIISHEDLCDDEFIALHGYEVAIKQDLTQHSGLFMKVLHFNMIAKSQDNLCMPLFFANNPSCPGNSKEWMDKFAKYEKVIDETQYNIDWINSYLKEISSGGYLITYNHPQWSLQSWDTFLQLKNIHAIELINGHCKTLNDNTSLYYESMLRQGCRVIPVAGDDRHKKRDLLNAWTMIKAPRLTYEALMNAYEKGECYVSEGPEFFHLVMNNKKIIVKTSPVSRIVLLTQGRYCSLVEDEAGKCTEAEFEYCPEKFGSYFRIEITDLFGKKAYSNAYFTDLVIT